MPTWEHVCGACCGAENKRPHLRLKYLKVPETSNVKLWIMQSSFRCNKQKILRCSEDSTVCLNFGSGSDRIPNGLGVLALPRWKGQQLFLTQDPASGPLVYKKSHPVDGKEITERRSTIST